MQKFWLATLLVASMANGIENNPPYPVSETPQLPHRSLLRRLCKNSRHKT